MVPDAKLRPSESFEALLDRLADCHRREAEGLKREVDTLRKEKYRLSAELARLSGEESRRASGCSGRPPSARRGSELVLAADSELEGLARQCGLTVGTEDGVANGWGSSNGLRFTSNLGTTLPGMLEEEAPVQPEVSGDEEFALVNSSRSQGGPAPPPVSSPVRLAIFSHSPNKNLNGFGGKPRVGRKTSIHRNVRVTSPEGTVRDASRKGGSSPTLGELTTAREREGHTDFSLDMVETSGETTPGMKVFAARPDAAESDEEHSSFSSEDSDQAPGNRPSAEDVEALEATVEEEEVSEEAGHALLDKLDEEIDMQMLNKQKQRFRNVLKLGPGALSSRDLMRVLQRRGKSEWRMDRIDKVMRSLLALEESMHPIDHETLDGLVRAFDKREGSQNEVRDGGTSSSLSIDFDAFVRFICWQDLPEHVSAEISQEVADLQSCLLSKDVDELVATVSRSHTKRSLSMASLDSIVSRDLAKLKQVKNVNCLNATVGLVVILSIVTMALSMDISHDWIGWMVLEGCFAIVFIVEIAIKTWLLGIRGYFCADNWQWNWLDIIITVCTLMDLIISVSSLLADDGSGQSMAKLTLVLRALRLTRVARLVKLLRTPILAELANMLAGFLIGVPCMLWVLVFLTLIFATLGMVFRQVIGPEPGISYVAECGLGDFLPESTNECKLHWLYGEEFFGTVWQAMFTCFRCVLGDCTTRNGKSLTTHMSQGYGFWFDVTYCVGMVVVMFGLFNIITAIFVESTISGLKYNDVQRKYARMYEHRYVQLKLRALVMKMRIIREQGKDGAEMCNERTDYVQEAALSEQDFNRVLADTEVRMLLDDLGVSMHESLAHRLFEMLDSDHSGMVTISDLVDILMTVRGDLTKSDMITSWVSMRSLKEEFTGFKKYMKVMLENQIRMQESIKAASPTTAQQQPSFRRASSISLANERRQFDRRASLAGTIARMAAVPKGRSSKRRSSIL